VLTGARTHHTACPCDWRRRAAERGWPPPLRVAGRVLAGRAVESPDELEAAS
jgi:hypothetical protein